MSRGGRGGGRGGRGGGRGGFGGALPPMGLSFADIAALSREQTELYPPIQIPILNDVTESEKRICELQLGFKSRLRKSPYYIVETTRSNDLPRYSDKYRPSPASQPALKRKDLHAPHFPTGIYEGYFNPKKRRKTQTRSKKSLNINEIGEGDEEQEGSEAENRSGGEEEAHEDYDVDEEFDNDYAENYFDNGEGDDVDDLGGGGGGDDLGGGDYD